MPTSHIVTPEQFGATLSQLGDPIPSTAVCMATTQAFKNAFASFGGGPGIVQGSVGIYYVYGGAIGPQASYQALDGQGSGISVISDVTTGLTIQHGPGGSPSTLIDHSRVSGWTITRTVAPSCPSPHADGSPTSPSDGSGPGSIGYLHRYTANAVIADVTLDQSYVCYQEHMTTSAIVDVHCVTSNMTSGQTRYGVYSDSTGTALPGTSVNGSSYKRFTTINTSGLSPDWQVYGAYLQATNGDSRDQYWNESETANCHYGMVIQATGSSLNFDLRIDRYVHDQFGNAGLSIRDYTGGSATMTIGQGWTNAAGYGGSSATNAIELINC